MKEFEAPDTPEGLKSMEGMIAKCASIAQKFFDEIVMEDELEEDDEDDDEMDVKGYEDEEEDNGNEADGEEEEEDMAQFVFNEEV